MNALRGGGRLSLGVRRLSDTTKAVRRLEDEACLFNAAWSAAKGSADVRLPASAGTDPSERTKAIDTHVARQVALLVGSLTGPGYKPGVPPPGLSYAVEVAPSSLDGAGKGLRLRSVAHAGDVIAFYPGTVYTADEVKTMS